MIRFSFTEIPWAFCVLDNERCKHPEASRRAQNAYGPPSDSWDSVEGTRHQKGLQAVSHRSAALRFQTARNMNASNST